jgi:hypothetical protein
MHTTVADKKPFNNHMLQPTALRTTEETRKTNMTHATVVINSQEFP